MPCFSPCWKSRHAVRFALLYPALVVLLLAWIGPTTGLFAQDQAQQDQAKEPQAEPEKSLTDILGGEDRYTTHLATDKPIYRSGETVYVRGTVLHAFTHKPMADHREAIQLLDDQINVLRQANNPENRQAIQDLSQQRWQLHQRHRLHPMVEIKDPKGATVVSGRTNLQDSTLGFTWQVPEDQAGGEYTVKVTYPWSGLAPAERTFDIRAYRPPRIKTQIDFLKDGYGPGDTVVATVEATRAEGGIPEGAKVTAIARVDGDEVARVQTVVRETGSAEVRFDLPGQIERGEGSLTFVVEDGGVVESASKTLPILLQTVDLQFYPEGGDLIAGVENRVYFEARTPFGKPADIQGVIQEIMPSVRLVQEAPFSVVTLTTTHEGRGVFRFTPRSDRAYYVQINQPSSVTQTFELPEIKQSGITLNLNKTVLGFDDRLRVHLSTPIIPFAGNPETPLIGSLTVKQRERVVFEHKAWAWSRSNNGRVNRTAAVEAKLPDTATGILTVTAYDAKGKPLAERLIYRAPKDHVNIEIVPNSAQYTPSGQVQLTIKTTDAQGKPVSAVAGLTVTDDAVLEMIEKREQSPALPAMVFLEQEVNDLADAHVYLDPKNPDAATQLDLLLGTQGWRRFALVNLEDFILEHGDDARRLFALRVPVQHEILKGTARLRRGRDEAGEFGEALLGAAGPEKADDTAPVAPTAGAPLQAIDGERLQQALENAAKQQGGQGLFLEEKPADRVAGRIAFEPPMVFIREYAHKQPAGKLVGQRSDFTETVYWSSATKTDEAGLAIVTFDLSDAVTSFRVKADAFTKQGTLGAASALIESVQPFYVEPKLPLELTAGDKVLLPIAMVNNTAQPLSVELLISKLGRAGTVTLDPVALGANTRGRALHELTIGQTFGELAFNIEARAGAFSDQNNRKLRIVPKGFPIDDGRGGMLNPDSEIHSEITVPDSIVPGSLSTSVTVYPTPLANLTEALEALIREPSGCFEQTSATTFPLVMAQQYFLSHQGVDPELIAKAKAKLDKGYKRLISFETKEKGYEWFGATPPHEALTAYGLLQFNEMKDVMDVDQAMIDRTADWLLSRRDGKGSFTLSTKGLDSFGRAPQQTTNAYVVWALLESGYDPAKLTKEIDHVLKQATEGDDAYIIALGANIAQLDWDQRDQSKEDKSVRATNVIAHSLRRKLADKLSDEGFVQDAVTSITRSGGDALKIETTSLAILAWLHDDVFTQQVEKSILWLTERCKAGRFGSTQSTVLALKAIVAYDKARSTPKAPGSLQLFVDGQAVGEPIAFNEETKGAIKLPNLAKHLTPGKHNITVKMQGGSKMPYSIALNYHANTPASSSECKLRITARLPIQAQRERLPFHASEGETTEVHVTVTNVTDQGLPTPIAIVGIPGGLEPSYDQLKELVAAGKIAAFEVIGRDVVLYWREMKPKQVIDLSIRCVAAVPGTYTGPASRAYLYYTDEDKDWAQGLTVTIAPREE